MALECLSQLKEEITHTDAFPEDMPGVQQALTQLQSSMTKVTDQDLLNRSLRAAAVRMVKRNEAYDETVKCGLLQMSQSSHLVIDIYDPYHCLEADHARTSFCQFLC